MPARCCRGPIDGRTDSVVLAPGGARRDAARRVAEQLTGPCPTLSKGVAFADDLRSDSAADGGRCVAPACDNPGRDGAGNAASDFDPDDVQGPLDLRWVGAWLTQDGEFRITIAFYDGFRVSALPTVRHSRLRGRGQVSVDLAGYITGLYVRRHGRIVFLNGDFGSSCGLDFPRGCLRAQVRR